MFENLDPRDHPTVDLETARQVLGIGRSTAYAAVQRGDWPTPIIRVGRAIRIPTQALLDLVGLSRPA